MTSLLQPSRAFSHQIASRISQLEANPKSCANRWSRVVFSKSACLSTLLQSNTFSFVLSQGSFRSFATKPKAHTGRVVASKRKPAAARSDEVAGTPKKTPAKRAPAKRAPAKKASAKKAPAKRRATTKKPAAKKGRVPKSKTKPLPVRRRKPLTEKQQAAKEKKNASQKTKDLKKIALLEVPKRLPSTAFTVLSREACTKGTIAIQSTKDAALQYKNLAPEEMERLNHVANENKAKNDMVYKKWLAEHTPAEIKAANLARLQLRKQAKKDGKKTLFAQIQDERYVKQMRSSYAYFLADRFASGDMKHMKIGEVGSLIGQEWRALSAGQKKPYEDRAAKDKIRYNEEYTTVYGMAPQYMKRAATKKAT